jgi:hypothetical protein
MLSLVTTTDITITTANTATTITNA